VVRILVDTCVLSEFQRPVPNERVSNAFDRYDDREIHLSAITIGEIAKGIALLEPGKQQFQLKNWLHEIEDDYLHQILPVDREVARVWGENSARLRRVGITIPVADGLIAATAVYHTLPLMSRNTRHFQPLDIEVIDPWEG
jgi:predicted nucleic acid-binding protein